MTLDDKLVVVDVVDVVDVDLFVNTSAAGVTSTTIAVALVPT